MGEIIEFLTGRKIDINCNGCSSCKRNAGESGTSPNIIACDFRFYFRNVKEKTNCVNYKCMFDKEE